MWQFPKGEDKYFSLIFCIRRNRRGDSGTGTTLKWIVEV